MPVNFNVYAGHDNDATLSIYTDGVLLDLTQLSGNQIELELEQVAGGGQKTVNMATDPARFTVHPGGNTGQVQVMLGSLFTDADTGRWAARLVLYDTTHTGGVRHGEPIIITVQK